MDNKFDRTIAARVRNGLTPRSPLAAPHFAFTLVELLVVITIIGILAALITVAAVGALKTARRAEVKAEVGQVDGGFNEVKNKFTAFPPNCQTDGTDPISEARVFADLKRFMKIAFPRHQEPDALLAALVGCNYDPSTTALTSIPMFKPMAGGMTAGEAMVFWVSGFSQDPKFPISGEGGPSYDVTGLPSTTNYQKDPIESRKWTFPCKVERLVPRGADNYFDSTSTRFVEYFVTINGVQKKRRINFWQYVPRKSEQPYVYFDTSRYAPVTTTGADPLDPPAATAPSAPKTTSVPGLAPAGGTNPLYIFAFKKRSEATNAATVYQFINPDKFQVVHCGINDRWDEETFKNRMSMQYATNINNILTFPEGPFTGDIGETIPNFTTETKLEDVAK